MNSTPHFIVQDGKDSKGEAFYLPYGTRTLRINVTNNTGQPSKLWLRPDNIPRDYRSRGIIRGYADGDEDLWIHWAGGEECGAAVKTREKTFLQDLTYKVWEVKSVELDQGETRPVYINITHRFGAVKPRALTLRAITGEGEEENEQDCNSTLKVQLESPEIDGHPVKDPVRATEWAGTRLAFEGTQVPTYVSRWWPPSHLEYVNAGGLAARLSLHQEGKLLFLKLDAREDGTAGITLAQVEDKDWEPGQDYHKLRVTQPELLHFGEDYYVVRLWFIWTDTGIGEGHEVPDAERVDVVFDRGATAGGPNVPYMGTDFHYQETWGLVAGEKLGEVTLGFERNPFSFFKDLLEPVQHLAAVFKSARQPNPAQLVRDELCGDITWRKGDRAHLPLLTNVRIDASVTSFDVRQS
jgi:hypothetical protein